MEEEHKLLVQVWKTGQKFQIKTGIFSAEFPRNKFRP